MNSLGRFFHSPASSAAVGASLARAFARRWECIKVEVPTMGESITEGSVQCWNKRVGDAVEVDDVIAVIDTDKISVDVVAPCAGVIKTIFADEGGSVEVGGELFEIDTEGVPTSQQADNSVSASQDDVPKQEGRCEKRVPLSRIRIRIGERLKSAQDTGVLLTTFQECDMLNLMALRKKICPEIKTKYDSKLGLMPFFIAACSESLKKFPSINSAIDGKDLLERNYHDISVAVATPTGLTVPVIRDVEKMSLLDLEKELARLANAAREGKISLDEMAGGNFTISNGGVYGSLAGTPIINPPQSAILGMHSIFERAVVREGKIVIRPIMYLALTYDHRIVDGREAVSFLKSVAEFVQRPEDLMESVPLVH